MIRRDVRKTALAACLPVWLKGRFLFGRKSESAQRIQVAQWTYICHDSGAIDVSLSWLRTPMASLQPGNVFRLAGQWQIYEAVGNSGGCMFGRKISGPICSYYPDSLLPGQSKFEPATA